MWSTVESGKLAQLIIQSGSADDTDSLSALLLLAGLEPEKYKLYSKQKAVNRAANIVGDLWKRDPSGGLLARLIDPLRIYFSEVPQAIAQLDSLAKCAGSTSARSISSVDVQPHNFDLKVIEEQCLTKLPHLTGLIGLSIPHCGNRIIDSVLDRIVAAPLHGRDVMKYQHMTLDPKFYSVNNPVQDIVAYWNSWLDSLESNETPDKRDSIFYVEAKDGIDAASFWEAVTKALGKELELRPQLEVKSKFIVVLMSNADLSNFDNIVILPAPAFDVSDVMEWVRTVVLAQNWPPGIIIQWRDYLLERCQGNDFEAMYRHIDIMLYWISGNPGKAHTESRELRRILGN